MDNPLILRDFYLSINSLKKKQKWSFWKSYLTSVSVDGSMESLDYINLLLTHINLFGTH